MATNEEKMTFAQRKHLLERIEKWSTENYWRDHLKSEKAPAAVTRAKSGIVRLRKIVEAWENAKIRRLDAIREKLKEAKTTAREAVLFGDPAKALAAVKKLEATKIR